MHKDIQNYLASLYLCSKTEGFPRTCPKCNKRHEEYRASTVHNWSITVEKLYTAKYRAYCFSCIQTELLLPSE